MKFILLVEGKTEKKVIGDFFRRWFKGKLTEKVGFSTFEVSGVDNLIRKASHIIEGSDLSKIISVIGLLDLYGLGLKFPDDLTAVAKRYNWAKNRIENEINNDRFRMFFAVHETEAWLFSDSSVFRPDINEKSVLEALSNAESNNPEVIDFDCPPSTLLERLYKDKRRQQLKRKIKYKKDVIARKHFSQLSPQIAHDKCPYLGKMLDEMHELAQAALK